VSVILSEAKDLGSSTEKDSSLGAQNDRVRNMNDLANHDAFVACCLRQPVMRRAPLTGLGYEATTAKTAPVVMSIGTSILPIDPLVGGIILGIGAVAALMGKLFGANPKNVPASQAEQVFEAAADNAYAVSKAGMVSRSNAIAAMQQFLEMGTQYINGLKLGTAGSQAVSNMTKVIQAEIAAAQSLPTAATKPIDIAAAHSVYKRGGGWYPASIQGATELTDQWLQSVPSTGGVSTLVGGASSSIAAAAEAIGLPADVGGLLSSPVVMIGLVIGAILLFARSDK